jgi:hypothetical protein
MSYDDTHGIVAAACDHKFSEGDLESVKPGYVGVYGSLVERTVKCVMSKRAKTFLVKSQNCLDQRELMSIGICPVSITHQIGLVSGGFEESLVSGFSFGKEFNCPDLELTVVVEIRVNRHTSIIMHGNEYEGIDYPLFTLILREERVYATYSLVTVVLDLRTPEKTQDSPGSVLRQTISENFDGCRYLRIGGGFVQMARHA